MPPIWVAKNPDEGVASARRSCPPRRRPKSAQPASTAAVGQRAVHSRRTGRLHAVAVRFLQLESSTTTSPILAGLNYFLTDGARGGEGTRLLGEKSDVKVWLGWLERRATAMSMRSKRRSAISRNTKTLRSSSAKNRQNHTHAISTTCSSPSMSTRSSPDRSQKEAYGKEDNVPQQLFEVYAEQKKGLKHSRRSTGQW